MKHNVTDTSFAFGISMSGFQERAQPGQPSPRLAPVGPVRRLIEGTIDSIAFGPLHDGLAAFGFLTCAATQVTDLDSLPFVQFGINSVGRVGI